MLNLQRPAFCLLFAVEIVMCVRMPGAAARPAQTPPPPIVIALQIVRASSAARILRSVFHSASIRIDEHSNSLIIEDPVDDPSSIRTVATALDVRDPMAPAVAALALHVSRPDDLAKRLRSLFQSARFEAGSRDTLIVVAGPSEMTQIQAVVAAIDTPPATPTPKPEFPPTVIDVVQRDPRLVARAVASEFNDLRVAVSGSTLVVTGPPDDVAQAKSLVAALDQPLAGVQYTRVYRIHNVQASSLASLLERSFRYATIEVDPDLNAISVIASTAIQQRIQDAISQLDQAPTQAEPQGGPTFGEGGQITEVVRLHAAVPATGGGASTSAAEVSQSVLQSLAGIAPDLHIVVHPNSTKLILTGSSRSIALAKGLISQLDVAEPLVELDTEVLEVDEGVQKQLGLKFPTPVLSTTYAELQPSTNDTTGVAGQLLRLQPLTRTPLTLGAELDFLVSTNKARILEDPRITTFSGRTASLHAGETVNILTTTGGGSGTVATTQVQSFQTGVTLDITPVVNTDDYVTVMLHPSVNSEAGISAAGLPNIQTRDTTTTVGLHDGETIVVGGLIEDDDSRTVSKIPILGDLPLIGKLFQDVGVNHTRNELIVTVTPHIVRPGASPLQPPESRLAPPTPNALPTIAPEATIPPLTRISPRQSQDIGQPSVEIATSPSPAPNLPAESAAPAPASSAVPVPLPSAFAQTNVFTFGAAPQNNFAQPSDPAQIFYVQVQPTVIRDGQRLSLSAITTTNVSSLSFGPSPTSTQVMLSSISPGKWQATITFSSSGLMTRSGYVAEFLTATTPLGASTSLKIPFSLISN